MSKSATSQALQKQTNTKSIFALTVAKFSLQMNLCLTIPAAAALWSSPAMAPVLPAGSFPAHGPEGLCEEDTA